VLHHGLDVVADGISFGFDASYALLHIQLLLFYNCKSRFHTRHDSLRHLRCGCSVGSIRLNYRMHTCSLSLDSSTICNIVNLERSQRDAWFLRSSTSRECPLFRWRAKNRICMSYEFLMSFRWMMDPDDLTSILVMCWHKLNSLKFVFKYFICLTWS
jgi:hypothetical protein